MKYLLGALALFASAVPAQGSDLARGAALYQNHCTTCHESQVHIRDQPKANTLAELRLQVTRWANEIHQEWGPDEIDDVFHYLNVTYYHLTR